MTTSPPSPLNSSMHTTCQPAAQVQAKDAGRRYKKLCVEMIADTEWRQGYGVQRSSQSVATTDTEWRQGYWDQRSSQSVATTDTEWRQGYGAQRNTGAQRSSQSVANTSAQYGQSSSFQTSDNLLKEW